jgi:hypothetical protein
MLILTFDDPIVNSVLLNNVVLLVVIEKFALLDINFIVVALDAKIITLLDVNSETTLDPTKDIFFMSGPPKDTLDGVIWKSMLDPTREILEVVI